MTKTDKNSLKKTLQVKVNDEELEALEVCKKYYGHKTDASLLRFALLRMAEAIKQKPLAITLNK